MIWYFRISVTLLLTAVGKLVPIPGGLEDSFALVRSTEMNKAHLYLFRLERVVKSVESINTNRGKPFLFNILLHLLLVAQLVATNWWLFCLDSDSGQQRQLLQRGNPDACSYVAVQLLRF